MKLSFSMNGWRQYSWDNLCHIAKDIGFNGIELHGIHKKDFSEHDNPFNADNASATKRNLLNLGIYIPCLDSICDIADEESFIYNCDEIAACIETASNFSIPYVRIHASNKGGVNDKMTDCLRRSVEKAQRANVILLIETVGVFADTTKLRDVFNTFASDHLAALWDLHHPYRYCGESAEQTVQNLGAYIKHVHIKDSLTAGAKIEYCLIGEGEIPVAEMMNALRSVNYDGYVSLEWDPEWMSDLNDIETIFAHFVNYMSRFDDPSKGRSFLYENKTRTGQFPWKKDILIDYTFSQMLDKMVDEFPDQYAVKYATLDYTRTYSQFRDDVDNFARTLVSMGVRPGHHVAIWATNIPQWYITFWAATKIGAVLVTVNTAYKIHEAEYLLRQSDTHTLVMEKGYRDSDYAGIIQTLCPELGDTVPGEHLHSQKLPFLRNVITVGFRQNGCLTWEEAAQRASRVPPEEIRRYANSVNSHDVCNMQYTSGTTGFPKGVMLTHYNIVNNGKCIGDRMDLSTADRLMIHVPMFHCFGMVLAMTAAMSHGATILPLPYFSPKTALACINKERITAFHGVPTMFIAMLEHEDFSRTDFSYMRTGIMAGSPCPVSVMQDVVNKMNMSEITIVFGQTESSPGCTMSSADDPLEVRVATVGRPLPEIECKIVDPETGLDLPDGEMGEFVARGYNIMKGYYKMPAATMSAIDKDDWLHTGDIACRLADGNFKITGRLKDMIIRGGENIYPKEIEDFIYTHPKVSDVQVIGVPDEQYGEEIMACIILKAGESMPDEEIKKYVRDNMARHKVPRYVDFVDSFPMNAAGKIQKFKMREDAVIKLGLKKAADIETA